MTAQIKSKERVSEHGEVFTNEREVNAMLDMVKKEASDISSTFLEPACGNGNFLIEILSRKLKKAQRLSRKDHLLYCLYSLRAVASIYGIDIQQDNIDEAKARLYDLFFVRHVKLFNAQPPELLQRAMLTIMDRNIQCGNTLTFSGSNGTPLMISEWSIDDDFSVGRKDYFYQAMVETGCEARAVCVYPQVNIAWIDMQTKQKECLDGRTNQIQKAGG